MINFKNSNFLQFPRVDIVRASAGSGKTYALAKRYLQLIMSPQLQSEEMPLKTILAVTFTNKATLEMKQRILELLKRITLDSFKDAKEKEEITSILSLEEKEARKLAGLLLDQIIKHYDFFQVETIDSFIKTLLSGCAFHLRLGSGFRIKEDYWKYLRLSFDKLIDKLPADKKAYRAFINFLESYLFVENRESWLVKKDILELMNSLYYYTNTYGGILQEGPAEVKEIRQKKQIIIDCLQKILSKFSEDLDRRFASNLSSLLEKNKGELNIDTLSDSKYLQRKIFPAKKGVKVSKRMAELWSSLRKALGEFYELESFLTFNSYIEIFNLLREDFFEVSAQDNLIFLQELNNQAQSLIDENLVGVGELYYRLATRLRHYLIDEFQDTSRLQWRNLFPLIEEALSSGGSLFYVGDKKQAIYRFRGGEVSLFDSVRESLKAFHPEETVLNQNFRSQKEIVEFNNLIFSEDNLRRFIAGIEEQRTNSFEFFQEDINRVLNVFSDSKQKWLKENLYGYVKLERLKEENADEKELITREKLIVLIKELKDRFSYSDIAILTRENKEVKLFTSWLIEENIPVESEKTLNIREQPLIKELISFLKFLDSPIDNLSFTSFILGHIFQKASGLDRITLEDFFFKLGRWLHQEKKLSFFSEFRKEFPEVWSSLIEEFYKNVGFIPLYEFMISILGRFQVMENFSSYQGFFMKFLELIKEKEEDYAGLSSFLEFFESVEETELYVNISHEDSVKISTIHKAKGLEFPVVIIPFLELDIAIGSGGNSSRKPYRLKEFPGKILNLRQLKKNYGFYSEELNDEYKDEYLKTLIDELNNLYVAFTRAKYELYLFISEKVGSKKNLAHFLIPSDIIETGGKKDYGKREAGREGPYLTLPVSRYSDWIDILKDEFIAPSLLLNREKVRRGEVLHFMLSFIGNLSLQNKNECLKMARSKAGLAFPYIKKLNEYLKVLRDLLEDKKFQPFFYLEEKSVYLEKEVVNSQGMTRRIDRLIIGPKEIWIIDYKSSRDEFELYKEQLAEYERIIKSLYPGLNLKKFLIYLDTIEVEEVNS